MSITHTFHPQELHVFYSWYWIWTAHHFIR